MDTQPDVNLLESNPSSPLSTSDSEACNTASSRVHFGPLRSSEKKFISRRQTLHLAALNPPHSHSAGDSPRPPPQDLVDNENESDVEEYGQDYLRTGTPGGNRFLPDEPSSTLATRIMRAQDNPSPPPNTREDHDLPTFGIALSALPLVDTPQSSSPSPPAVTPPDHREEFSIPQLSQSHFSPAKQEPLHSPLGVNGFGPALQQLGTPMTTSPNDLISFDSFSAPSAADIPHIIPGPSIFSAESLDMNARPATVDDLLCRSPSPPILHSPRFTTPPPISPSPSPVPTPCGENGDHQEKLELLTDTEDCIVADASSPNKAESAFESPSLPTVAFPTTPRYDEGEEWHTSLRRSTRPRRSGTPYSGISIEKCRSTLSEHKTPSPRKQSPLLGPPSSRKRGKADSNIRQISSSLGGEKAESESPIDLAEEPLGEQESRNLMDQGKRQDVDGNEETRKKVEEAALRREFGFLSPPSSGVLTRMVPPHALAKTELDTLSEGLDPKSPRPILFSSPVFRPLTFSPAAQGSSSFRVSDRPNDPMSEPSPSGYVAQRSPRPKPTAIDNLNRTGARRIPIEQAIAQGQISPQKAAQFVMRSHHILGSRTAPGSSLPRSPVFPLRPSAGSPARRVPISPELVQGKRLRSPIRTVVKGLSKFDEPQTLGLGNNNRKDVVVNEEPKPPSMVTNNDQGSPVRSSLSRPTTTSKLPFPLVPTRGLQKPILEEAEIIGTESHTSADPSGTNSSPPKSDMRQRSTASRIPRIGVKPYARSTATTTSDASKANPKKTWGIMRRVDLAPSTDTAKAPKPFRMVQMTSGSGSGSGSSSDDANGRNIPAGHGTNFGSESPLRNTGQPEGSTLPTLKRKRGPERSTLPEKGSSLPLPRQVVSGQPNPNHPPKASAPTSRSPVKKLRPPLVIRRVVDRVLSDRQENVTSQQPNEVRPTDGPEEADSLVARRRQARFTSQTLAEDSKADGPDEILLSSPPMYDTSSPVSAGEALPQEPRSESLGSALDDEHPDGVRRTSRLRRTLFGQVDVRPLQPRRKTHTHPSMRADTNIFVGMSAVALRALTSSNTAKNQKYLAAKLETEVVRKEGMRPDSPTVKIKTILQRQEEEKERQRKDRAERRARRSDDGFGLIEPEGQKDHCDLGDVLLNGYCNGKEQEESGAVDLPKHPRGPGEEEDYETPVRPEWPGKRSRCDEQDEPMIDTKRVKWDRGLSTTIVLEDVRPQKQPRPKQNLVKKSCLAKTAKTLRLDVLGNIPNAEAPLADLVHENVVVKKFVYDNDLVPLTKMVLAKSTRTKSKKGKH